MELYADSFEPVKNIMNMDSKCFFDLLFTECPDTEYMSCVDKIIKNCQGLNDKRCSDKSKFYRDFAIRGCGKYGQSGQEVTLKDDLFKKIVTTYMIFSNEEEFIEVVNVTKNNFSAIANHYNTTIECVRCKIILDEYRDELSKNIHKNNGKQLQK